MSLMRPPVSRTSTATDLRPIHPRRCGKTLCHLGTSSATDLGPNHLAAERADVVSQGNVLRNRVLDAPSGGFVGVAGHNSCRGAEALPQPLRRTVDTEIADAVRTAAAFSRRPSSGSW